MPAAALPADEAERLQVLRSLDILGEDTDGMFDRSAGLASSLFGGVMGTVSLIDADTLHYKGAYGVALRRFPRDQAICTHALIAGGVMWIEDVSQDPRVSDLVAGSPVPLAFYAAAPIQVSGRFVGVLCVADIRPRAYDPQLAASLTDLAGLVGDTLALRLGRRQVDAALAAKLEAERISQAYVNHAPVAFMMLDREMRTLLISPRWKEDFKLKDKSLGVVHYDLMPTAHLYAGVHQRALAGEVIRGEAATPRTDGVIRYSRYEIAPWRDEAGAIGGIIIISSDVSDMVAARQATEQSEQRLALALEISRNGVCELDVANKRLFASGPAMRLLGRDLTYETVARSVFDICHPDDRGWVGRAWQAHIDDGEPYDVEHRLDRPDGEVAWVHAFAEAVKTPEGRIDRIVGVLSDVTARKQGELQLAAAIRAAEAANLAKSEFLANMSHELRTPLNGVTGVTGALARTDLNPRQAEMVSLIEASADALSRLLSDVLDLARVDSGRLELHAEAFQIDAFVQGVGTLFQWRAKDKGVAFVCEVEPELSGRYMADVVRLRQILSNLLSNAVKFTAEGEVRLRVQPGPAPGELAFVVTDTGIGFTAEQGARLFERFSQGDGSITRRFGGSGLGLAISRALAVKMGGRLEAKGAPGIGAVFSLILPLSRTDASAGSVEGVSAPAPVAAGARVLLAEDHPINRKVVELILGAAGLQLVSVENGQEALTALRHESFDLVLMDMQMPVMDGLSAIRALREFERAGGPRTPVISLTANALPEHVRASLDAGADEHMSKPIAAATLLEAVFRLMRAPNASGRRATA